MAGNRKHASKAAYDEGDLYRPVNWDEVPDPVEDNDEDKVVELIKTEYEKFFVESHRFRGDRTVVIKRDGLVEIVQRLKDDPELSFKFLMDETAVDYLGQEPRFEVVYHLVNHEKNWRLRLKVKVSEKDCWVPTLVPLYEAANWFEREIMEFFGIDFKGHPEKKKLFLYDEFKGYPLRKDYPYNKRQPLIKYRDVGLERNHYPGERGSGLVPGQDDKPS